VFAEHGINDVLGLDGPYVAQSQLQIPGHQFQPADLAVPVTLDRRFDLAVSLEVAEHLPAGSARGFVRSLTLMAPVVLFSAAVPHQGGNHHINEQWPEYWARYFGEFGFIAIDCLRRQFCHNPEVEWWYAQNVLLFAGDEALRASPSLRTVCENYGGVPQSFVHPRRYLEWIEWGLSQVPSCR
jgi:hypothetical protein